MYRNVVNWYLQRISGALLLLLLIAHFWVEHYVADNVRRGELTYQIVLARVSHPYWQVIDISFLLIALYHGLNGVRNILLDYNFNRRTIRVCTVALFLVGLVWAYWGIEAFSKL